MQLGVISGDCVHLGDLSDNKVDVRHPTLLLYGVSTQKRSPFMLHKEAFCTRGYDVLLNDRAARSGTAGSNSYSHRQQSFPQREWKTSTIVAREHATLP